MTTYGKILRDDNYNVFSVLDPLIVSQLEAVGLSLFLQTAYSTQALPGWYQVDDAESFHSWLAIATVDTLTTTLSGEYAALGDVGDAIEQSKTEHGQTKVTRVIADRTDTRDELATTDQHGPRHGEDKRRTSFSSGDVGAEVEPYQVDVRDDNLYTDTHTPGKVTDVRGGGTDTDTTDAHDVTVSKVQTDRELAAATARYFGHARSLLINAIKWAAGQPCLNN